MNWLLVTSAWPWPVRRGLQARTAQIASILAQRGEVTILCPEPPPGEGAAAPAGTRVETYRRSLAGRGMGVARAAASGRALQSGLFSGRDLERRIESLAGPSDRVLVQTSRFASIGNLRGVEKLEVDLIDSLSLNFASRARLDRPWLRPLWRFEARRLERDERRLVATGRSAMVVCDRDRRHLEATLGEELALRIGVVPLVLDATAARRVERAPRDRSFTLLLTGNLGYFPTLHGLGWFLEEVLPEVRARHGAARLLVAGSRPSAALARRLHGAGAELVREPPDLAPLFAAADLALAPLFGGSGTPMKLLEAIAAGVPALATPYAAAGLESEVAAGVENAPDAAAWIAAIGRCARERDSWEARAAAAGATALHRHSAMAVSERFWRTVDR